MPCKPLNPAQERRISDLLCQASAVAGMMVCDSNLEDDVCHAAWAIQELVDQAKAIVDKDDKRLESAEQEEA